MCSFVFFCKNVILCGLYIDLFAIIILMHSLSIKISYEEHMFLVYNLAKKQCVSFFLFCVRKKGKKFVLHYISLLNKNDNIEIWVWLASHNP